MRVARGYVSGSLPVAIRLSLKAASVNPKCSRKFSVVNERRHASITVSDDIPAGASSGASDDAQ